MRLRVRSSISEAPKLIEIERIVTGSWKENCYIVRAADRSAVIIDPGGEFSQIERYVEKNELRPLAVLNTHAHYDHIGAVAELQERYGIPFYLHRGDFRLLQSANFYQHLFLGQAPIRIPQVNVDLAECPVIELGGLVVEVLRTPGHTPGGVCFFVGGVLFTGDTLMARDTGRTDLPGGDHATLVASLDRLAQSFSPQTEIYPGHGPTVTLESALAARSHSHELGH